MFLTDLRGWLGLNLEFDSSNTEDTKKGHRGMYLIAQLHFFNLLFIQLRFGSLNNKCASLTH